MKYTIEELNEMMKQIPNTDPAQLKRDIISDAKKGTPWSDEQREKYKLNPRTVFRSDETIEKVRLANLGKKRTEEQHANMSAAQKNKKPVSDETRRRLSESKTGEVRDEETRKKMSDSWDSRKATWIKCDVCGAGPMWPWQIEKRHNANCKKKV